MVLATWALVFTINTHALRRSMPSVNLSFRLLIYFSCIAVLSTAGVGLLVRMEWRQTESDRFEDQVRGAREGITVEIRAEQNAVQDLLRPLCKHDAFVDRTLVDLEAGRLDSGRRLAIAQLVPEEMKALRLDELVLVTGSGEVLGAGHDPSLVGVRRKDFAAALSTKQDQHASVRAPSQEDGKSVPAALTGHCVAGSGGRKVGLIGARHIRPLLDRMGKAYGVRLAFVGAPNAEVRPDDIAQRVVIDESAGLQLVVAKSRRELDAQLKTLDRWVLTTGGVTLFVAILLAIVLARSLAKPLSALSHEVGEVVDGEPREVSPRGTPEMRRLAEAFNKTLRDLVALRKRHAAIERIAAWREVARRVAHEIKNPLTPIRSSVETLRRLKDRDDPKFDEYFEEATKGILDDVHRIAAIASDFARFARLPSPRPAPVDLAEVFGTVVSMHTTQGISVALEAKPCPIVQADRDQLGQMLTNLVQNAMDAVRSGTDNPTVRVMLEPDGPDRVRLRVLDNGPGVPDELLPKLFEPYVTTKDHGTGLGLSIVQRIVVEHGGEIAYEPGHGGACFTVVLPCSGPGLAPDSRDPAQL
jgi:signal transduction histidine kinase